MYIYIYIHTRVVISCIILVVAIVAIMTTINIAGEADDVPAEGLDPGLRLHSVRAPVRRGAGEQLTSAKHNKQTQQTTLYTAHATDEAALDR